MNAKVAHIVDEIKELSAKEQKELKVIINQLGKEEIKKTLPTYDLGGQFDHVNIRRAAYEE